MNQSEYCQYQTIIIVDLTISYFYRFVPRTVENDYIKIFRDGGCYSHLGKKFGEQDLSLAVACLYSVGTPIHEFMHAIGIHSNSQTLTYLEISIYLITN